MLGFRMKMIAAGYGGWQRRKIIHGSVVEMIRIGFSNKTLRHFNGLHHIRQPAVIFRAS